jgi:hypothetical protein
MTWRKAFLEQAMSDYERFQDFRKRPEVPLCHKLHYLQMASEKLAKAFMAYPSGKQPPERHDVLVAFLRVSKRDPEIKEKFKGKDYQNFCYSVEKALKVADWIEKLVPKTKSRLPNPEYPWLLSEGNVISPVRYTSWVFSERELYNFTKLVDVLFTCVTRMD